MERARALGLVEITARTPITGSKIFGAVKAPFAVSQQHVDHPFFKGWQ